MIERLTHSIEWPVMAVEPDPWPFNTNQNQERHRKVSPGGVSMFKIWANQPNQ